MADGRTEGGAHGLSLEPYRARRADVRTPPVASVRQSGRPPVRLVSARQSAGPPVRLARARPAAPRHQVRVALPEVASQLAAADGHGLLVPEPLRRLRVRLHLLLCPLRAPLRGRAGARCGEALGRRVPRIPRAARLGGVRAAHLRRSEPSARWSRTCSVTSGPPLGPVPK